MAGISVNEEFEEVAEVVDVDVIEALDLEVELFPVAGFPEVI
ncbi:MAG: hypothetical protein ACRECH_03505 [Nitrososphaerales archaeon]